MGITVYIVEHCLFNSVNHEDGKIDTKNRPRKLAPTGCLMSIKQWTDLMQIDNRIKELWSQEVIQSIITW